MLTARSNRRCWGVIPIIKITADPSEFSVYIKFKDLISGDL